MKKRTKNFFRTLFRYAIPVKKRGTIGIIQRTLVISNWTFLLLIIISIVLETLKTSCNNWIGFFETFAIGSACSIVIVIITTVIQFVSIRNEKASRFIRYITNISEQLYWVKVECSLENIETTKSFVDYLKKLVSDFSHDFEELYWFNAKTDDLYRTISKKLLKIDFGLVSDPTFAYDLNSQEVKEIVLKSYQLIKIVNPNGNNYLDGVVKAINDWE